MKGNIDELLLLGTLGASALISDLWDETVKERTLISSIVCNWSLARVTNPQGPIVFGVAHSDYTDSEILAVITATGSWDGGDKIAQEVAKRLVRQIGTLQSTGSPAAGETDYRFNDGRTMKTKLNWLLNEGDTLRMWAFNRSAAALSTTDPGLRCSGHANLWKR